MAYTPETPPALQYELEYLRMINTMQLAYLATLIDQLLQQFLPPPLVPEYNASIANSALLSDIIGLSNTLSKVSSDTHRSRKKIQNQENLSLHQV